MCKKIVSKTLLALAISGAMTYAVATTGTSDTNASQNNAVVSSDATLKLFEAWVADLQKASSSMSVYTLKDYKAEGDRATGTINNKLKTMGGNQEFTFASDSKVVVENGITLSKHGMGAAKIEWTTALSDDTNEEIVEILGKEPFIKAEGIVTLAGDIHVDLKNPAPFKREFDRVILSIPSFTGEFHSYNARSTGDMTMSIPSMEISDTFSESADKASGAWLTNSQFKMTDRPIKTGYWDFVGSSSGSVEKIDVRNRGVSVFTLSNMTFSEKGQMDDKKLYSDDMTMKAEGSFNHPATQQPIKIDTFQMDVSIKNMQVDAYLAVVDNIYSERPDTKKLELQALELMKYEPQVNFDKITLSINGNEGTASIKMSIAKMTDDEKKNMPLYLAFLQKFKFEAAMDIPDAWITILFPKEADQMNMMLTMGEQEGYLVRKDGRIKTDCKYEMGNLTVNGKPIKGAGGLPF